MKMVECTFVGNSGTCSHAGKALKTGDKVMIHEDQAKRFAFQNGFTTPEGWTHPDPKVKSAPVKAAPKKKGKE